MTGWMGALTLVAILLGAVLLATNSRPAEANMLNAQSGFSLMTAGAMGQDEVLIVIDKGAQKMIVYNLVNGKDLRPVAGYDLARK